MRRNWAEIFIGVICVITLLFIKIGKFETIQKVTSSDKNGNFTDIRDSDVSTRTMLTPQYISNCPLGSILDKRGNCRRVF